MSSFKQLKKMKTLLVDDDELIRDALVMAFKIKGCLMRAVETAEEGLGAIKKERFDIIICDRSLPGINGLEFLKSAKVFQPDAVRLLITAYRDQDIVSESAKIGTYHFIQKPFSVGALAETMAQLVKKHRSE